MKLYLKKIRLNMQGYTAGKNGQCGKYYGVGWPVYVYESEDGFVSGSFRAIDRFDAKECLKIVYGDVSFFN